MLKKFLPQQENFFALFQEIAANLLETTNQFQQLLNHLDNQAACIHIIENHKNHALRLTRSTFEILRRTFITPFDRHDIHKLTSEFSSTFDIINRTVQRITIHELTAVPAEICSLAALAACAAALVKAAINHLNSLKNSASILKLCGEINLIENEADKILLAGVAELFRNTDNFKQLLIMKEIYEYTGVIINQFLSLSNIIEGIVLEYS